MATVGSGGSTNTQPDPKSVSSMRYCDFGSVIIMGRHTVKVSNGGITGCGCSIPINNDTTIDDLVSQINFINHIITDMQRTKKQYNQYKHDHRTSEEKNPGRKKLKPAEPSIVTGNNIG